MTELLEDASPQKPHVYINCSFQLDQPYYITKRLLIHSADASHIRLDFAGSTLEGQDPLRISVRSVKRRSSNGKIEWSSPSYVTIKNAKVMGGIRVSGMTANDLRPLSRQPGLTKKAQDAAPSHITLLNMHFTVNGNIPVYVEPGVTYFTLKNSVINGHSDSVAIYLDAESGHHLIKNNHIHSMNSREAIAIDGSAHNKILNNVISANKGGLFLYRNCGERSVSRHQGPQHNIIINNRLIIKSNPFFGKGLGGIAPAVHIGSRQGNRRYCKDDRDSRYGSGVSDRDYAFYNAVVENQILDHSPTSLIIDNDLNNFVEGNVTVSKFIKKKSSCYAHGQVIRHGEHSDFSYLNGTPTCVGKRFTCDDGEIKTESVRCPESARKTFGCRHESNNGRCETSVQCPKGYKLFDIKLACNLESPGLSNAALNKAPWGQMTVVRASDVQSQGQCRANSKEISAGKMSLSSLVGQTKITASCQEHDRNGGDCAVRGEYLCVK